MSEQLHHPEHAHSAEKHEQHVEHVETHHAHEKAPEHTEKRPDDIEAIRSAIKQHAEHSPHKVEHHQQAETTNPATISRQFKQQALYRTLKNVRQQLSPTERTLSRIVHRPIVDAASEVSGKTIARPSGVLGGGICAFLGSFLFLYLAKHNGFHYNFMMFIVFFVGGFVIGLLAEIIFRLLYRVRNS